MLFVGYDSNLFEPEWLLDLLKPSSFLPHLRNGQVMGNQRLRRILPQNMANSINIMKLLMIISFLTSYSIFTWQ